MKRESAIAKVAFAWGVGGVVLLLADALWRLTPIAVEALTGDLTLLQWTFVASWVAFMLFVEGHRGFHQSFSPRVVARALYLREHARTRDAVLAPFFCMGLYGTTRRRLIAGWGMTAGIVSLILLVRTLSQPWRGLVDFGVVVALGYGLISTGYWLARGLEGRSLPFTAEVDDAADMPDGAGVEADSLARARVSLRDS